MYQQYEVITKLNSVCFLSIEIPSAATHEIHPANDQTIKNSTWENGPVKDCVT